MSKSPDSEDKKMFKSLNEIFEIKQKEKQMSDNLKGYKRSKLINGFEFGRALGKGKFG